LIHLLDHATPVSKGKAALSIMFIIKFNINTLVALSEESLHFYTVLDKGFREQNEYFK
jgi:serine/threonine-protein kinase ULK4